MNKIMIHVDTRKAKIESNKSNSTLTYLLMTAKAIPLPPLLWPTTKTGTETETEILLVAISTIIISKAAQSPLIFPSSIARINSRAISNRITRKSTTIIEKRSFL